MGSLHWALALLIFACLMVSNPSPLLRVRGLGAGALGMPAPSVPALTMRVCGAGVEGWAALGGDAGAAMQAAAGAVFGPGMEL